MANKSDPFHRWLLLVGLLLVGGLGYLLMRSQALPDGPEVVIWGKQPCEHCRMHVSEPAFAAQLHEKDGRVHHFDDPGCLFAYERDAHPKTHEVWFHHLREDRWMRASETGFIPVAESPMGFGLGAVDASVPKAMSSAEAARYLATKSGRSGDDAAPAPAHDHAGDHGTEDHR